MRAARRPRFFGPVVAVLAGSLLVVAPVPVPGLGSSEVRAQSAAPVGVVLSAWGGDAGGDVVEGAGGSAGYKFVVVSLSRVLGAGESVTVPLSVDGAAVGVDYTLGLAPAVQAGVSLVSGAPFSAQDPAVLFAAGSSSATLRFSALDNGERSQPFVRIDTAAPSHSGLPGGLGAPTGGPIGFAIVDDETGDIELDSSALDPASADFAFAGARQAQTSERVAGSRYRLMIKTPAAITGSDGASVVAYPGTTATADADATTSRTDAYDTYMRLGIAQDYHDDNLLQPYSGFFKAFVSGASLDARDRVSLTSGGALQADIGVHMLGPGTLDGDKVADDFADLCDGSWDAEVTVSHRGADAGWDSGSGELAPWTGTLDDCTASAGPLGHATAVTHGGDETDPLDSATAAPAGERPLYAMITVNLRRTVRSVTLSVDDAVVDEGDGATTITVTATVDGRYVFDEDKTVSVAVAGSGDAGAVGFTTDKADDSFDIIIPAMAESATGTFTLTPTDDTDLESDETVTVSGTITPMTANDEFHSGFTLNPASITLTDDDESAYVVFSEPVLHLTEGGPAQSYNVSLSENPKANVRVYVTSPDRDLLTVSSDGGATRYEQIVLRFTRRNWDSPQVVTVEDVTDANKDSEQDERIHHIVTDAAGKTGNDAGANFKDGPYFGHVGDEVSVYITDDDAAPTEGLTVEYRDGEVDLPIVVEEGGSATLALEWSRALTAAETAAVRLRVTGGDYGNDYTVATNTPGVTVTTPPDGTVGEITVQWSNTTGSTANLTVTSVDDGSAASGERYLVAEFLSAYSPDDSAGKDSDHRTPDGVRLKNGPETERIHVLAKDRVVVAEPATSQSGRIDFMGLETADDPAELTTDGAYAQLAEDGSTTHYVAVSLSAPPAGTGDVVVSVATSDLDSEKLTIVSSSDADGVADTVTFTSGNYGRTYTVGLMVPEDVDSDDEVAHVHFTVAGYAPAYTDGTSVRSFRVDIADDDPGVEIEPTALTLTEGVERYPVVPGSAPKRHTNEIAMRLKTDPGARVRVTPTVSYLDGTDASGGVWIEYDWVSFTGGACTNDGNRANDEGNWCKWKTIETGYKLHHRDDSVSNEDKQAIITWRVSRYSRVRTAPEVRLTLLDDDPGVRITPGTVNLVEGAGTATYDIVLNAPPPNAGDVVLVSASSGDAGAVSFDGGGAANLDRPIRFGINDWHIPHTVTVHPETDGDGDDETVTISHTVSDYGSVSTAPDVTVNVLDKDGPPGIVLSTDSLTVPEGSSRTFTVRLAGRPSTSGSLTLKVRGSGGDLTVDTDPATEGNQKRLVIPQAEWHRPRTVIVSAADESDAANEVDETFTLTVALVGGTPGYDDRTVAVTVHDDEFDGPTFTVTGGSAVTEGGVVSARFTVEADVSPAADIDVTLNISETSDFVAAGDEGDQTVTFVAPTGIEFHVVPIVNDNVADEDGTVTATLKPGTGYRVGELSVATIDVTDDGDTGTATPVVQFGAAIYSVGEASGSRTVSVAVSADSAPAASLSVAYTIGGSATNGTDYSMIASPVPLGTDGSGTISITVTDDMVDDDDETIELMLSDGADYDVGTLSSTVVTITDNDTAGVTVAESGAGTGVPEDDATMTDSYSVVLDSEPLVDVVVRVSAADGVQVDGPAAGRSWVSSVDLTFASSGAGVWSSPQTVTVRGVDDMVDNPGDARSVRIGHVVHSGDGGKYTAALMVDPVDVSVSDEDSAPTRVDLSTDRASAVSEGAGSTAVAVTATVHGSTRFGVAKTVRVSVAASADSSSVNYVDMDAVSSFDVVIQPGERTAMGSFDIEPDDDNVHESDNSVAVTGAVTGDSSVTVNAATSIALTNDDAAPTAVGLAVSPSSVTEGGGAQSISVEASVGGTTRFGVAKTVAVSVAGHDTAGRVNFAPVSGFGITIPAEVDDHSVSFTLTPVVNVWSETDGEAAVSGTLGGVTVSGASVTLTDDDAAPSGVSLSVSTSSLGEADGATVITVTATVDGSTRYGSARTVTVTVAGSGGTNAVDFTATAPPAITISAGAETGETTFTLTPTDDSVDEFDETVTVSGSGTGVASVSSAAITLVDDDATSVGLSAPSGAVGEAGGTKDVTVGLSRALVAGESVSVPLDVVGVTAGDDYTLALEPSLQAGVSLSQSGSDSAQAPVVSLGVGASSAVLRFTAVDNAARTQPFAVVRFGSGARAPSGTGVSIAAPSGARAGWAITDDETGDIVVPRSWALGPSGVNSAGEPEFRLVFATSAKRDASSGDIGVYDSFVRGLLAEGHVDIVPYAGFFTVLGSTSGAALADHAGVAGSASVPFYWLGETGDTTKRVAAGDMGFRGEWISTETPSSQSVPRDESGTVVGVDSAGYWTGSTAAGGRSANPLGSANVTLGYLNDSGAGRAPLGSGQTAANSATRAFFGLSPVFVTASDPVISVTLPSAQAASDAEGSVLDFTVSADPAPDGPLTVQLWVSEPSGRAMVADGLEGLDSVSFAAGETSKAYTVATTQDSDDEADSRVEVRVFGAGAGAGYTAHATAESASVLVRDDEATTITLGGGGQTINEGQTATVTVTLGRDLLAGEEVDVPLERASASTATANTDWTAACSGGGVNCTNIYGANPVMAITGGAGTQQVGTVTFTALPDAVHPEAAETIDIDRDSVASAAVTGSGGGVTYTGDPAAITITSVAPAAITASFDSDAYSAGEDAADRSVTVQVNLSTAAPSGGLTVTYTASGSAAAADYSGASGSVSIAAGQTSANISISITDDALAEGSETLVLTISDGAGYDPGTPAATTITIADNDPAPGTITLTVDDASVSEDDGATAIEVTATIVGSSRFATAQTVAVSVAGSGAANVVGFTATPSMFNITIAAGAASGAGSFTLTPQNDNTAEGDETVTVSGSLTGVTVNSAAVTLTDDDGAPTHVTLTVDVASVSEDDAATPISVTATIVGSSRFATAQTVAVSVAGSGAANVVGFTASPSMFNVSIAAGAASGSGSFTLTPQNDNTAEGDETVTVSGSLTGVTVNSAAVTLTDDDGTVVVPVTVALAASGGDSDGNAREGAAGATGYVTVTVTLGRALSGGETVTVPLTVQGATVTSDYSFGLRPASQAGVSLLTGGAHSAQDPAVHLTAGASAASLRLTPVNNNARTQPYVVVAYGTGARAPSADGGATLGAVTGGPVGVVLVDNETGDITVASNWALAPSGLSGGDDFRLLFRSSSTRDATSTDIGVYDAFIREALAAGGHADIKPYAGFFKVFASTRSTSGSTGTTARVHNAMAAGHTGHFNGAGDTWADGSTVPTAGGAGTPTYWLNGAILANNYADLCDQAVKSGTGVTTGWDVDDPRSEDGARNIPSGATAGQAHQPWTGSGNACEAYNHPLGNSTVSRGASHNTTWAFMHYGHAANTQQRPLYGYSPVFKIAGGAVVPVADFDAGTSSAAESAGTTNIMLRLAPPPSGSVTVAYTLTGDAARGSDYTISGVTSNSGTVMVGTSGTAAIPVAIIDDMDVESAETVTITLNAGAGYTVGTTRPAHTLTITDDDATDATPRMSFASATHRAVENEVARYPTVWMRPVPSVPVTVNYVLDTGRSTATLGEDYRLGGTVVLRDVGGGLLAFSVDVEANHPRGWAKFSVYFIDDEVRERDETAVFELRGGSGYVLGDITEFTLTISDDGDRGTLPPPPARPTVRFASAASATSESAGARNVALDLSPAPTQDVTVRYSVSGSAARGTDYTIAGFGTVTVAAGARSVDIPVAVIDDGLEEGDETVVLALSGGSGYTVGSRDRHTLRITDDDLTVPRLTVTAGAAVPEGDAASFTINSTHALSNLAVRYTVTQNGDYVTSGAPGAKTRRVSGTGATFTIPTRDDGADEADGSVTVTLNPAQGYTVGSPGAATVTVTDDDVPRAVFASASSRVDEDAGTRNVRIDISPAPHEAISVGYRIGGTATPGSDYTALSGTVNVAAGATSVDINITVIDDAALERNETIILTLSGGAGYTVGSPAGHTLTIDDDEEAPAVTFAAPSQTLDENTGTRNVTLNVAPTPTTPITVRYTVTGSAAPGFDYTRLPGSVRVNAGATSATIPITVTNDTLVEGDETIVLELSGPLADDRYTLGATPWHTVTIADDDATDTTPRASFFGVTNRIGENARSIYPTTLIDPLPTTAVTVNYIIDTNRSTATLGEDYRLHGVNALRDTGDGRHTFNVEATTDAGYGWWVKFTVRTLEDPHREGNETIVFRIQPGTGYAPGETTEYTLTITDND